MPYYLEDPEPEEMTVGERVIDLAIRGYMVEAADTAAVHFPGSFEYLKVGLLHPTRRKELIRLLAERGIDVDEAGDFITLVERESPIRVVAHCALFLGAIVSCLSVLS